MSIDHDDQDARLTAPERGRPHGGFETLERRSREEPRAFASAPRDGGGGRQQFAWSDPSLNAVRRGRDVYDNGPGRHETRTGPQGGGDHPRRFGDGLELGPRDGGDAAYGSCDPASYGRRPLLTRAQDEIAAWLGDENAARRRLADDNSRRGKGPSGYVRSDDRLREDVCDLLTDDPIIDARNIEVSVKDREVTLDGHVQRFEDKRRAEDLTDRVYGIAHVQNNLRHVAIDEEV